MFRRLKRFLKDKNSICKNKNAKSLLMFRSINIGSAGVSDFDQHHKLLHGQSSHLAVEPGLSFERLQKAKTGSGNKASAKTATRTSCFAKISRVGDRNQNSQLGPRERTFEVRFHSPDQNNTSVLSIDFSDGNHIKSILILEK